MVQHVGCARKCIQHHPAWKKAKEMLDKCLKRFKRSSNIFYKKKCWSNIIQYSPQTHQHFLSNMLNNVCRPLNTHGFTVCHMVSLFFLRCHGKFFIWFYKFWADFFPSSQFSKKTKHMQHIPMLIKNAFLVWLTKVKQELAVIYLWFRHYCSVWYILEATYWWRRILVSHFNGKHNQTC